MKKYFVFSDGGIEDFFDTEQEAIKCAEKCIEDSLDCNEWMCENDDIFWGEIKQSGRFERLTSIPPHEYDYFLDDV